MKVSLSPFFSVIIPTYQRPLQLATCLQALAKLDYPRERFEVIVVDDGSELPFNYVLARLEHFLRQKDGEWHRSDEQLTDLGVQECAQIGLIEPHEVVVRMKKSLSGVRSAQKLFASNVSINRQET